MEDQTKQTDVEPNVDAHVTANDNFGNPAEETVGDIMKKSHGEGIKFWVVAFSALVYLAGIVYAEVHALTMLQTGVAAEMRMWAQMGMIAAGISAILLPIALKTWTIESKQRTATYMFYVLDFCFLALNAFVDFNTQKGQTLAPWAQTYVTYILPASPIIIAAFWALIWELDPSVKEAVLRLSLRAAMKQKMAHRVAEAAKGASVTATVNAAAEREVERALTELFGVPVSGYVMRVNEPQQPNGLLNRFFGSLSKAGQHIFSAATPSQSPQSPSDQQDKQ